MNLIKYTSLVIALCSMSNAMLQAQKLDRTKLPKPGPAPIIKLGQPAIKKLSNGITVLVVEDHKLPKINCTLDIDLGEITEGSKAGKLDILNQLISEGTTTKTKEEFDELTDEIGANVGLGYSGGSVSALSRYFDKAFSLFAEGMTKPALKEGDFKNVVKKYLTNLKSGESNPSAIGSRVRNAIIWGTNHPKGEYATPETVNSVTLDDVKEAYSKYANPTRAYVIFVGDITPTKAFDLVNKNFGKWVGAPLALEQPTPVINNEKNEIYLCDVTNAKQTSISAINVNTFPLNSKEVFPAVLANDILGGGGEGRLFMNLREKRGFTYGSYSNIGYGRNQQIFNAGAEVRHQVVDSAIEALIFEVNEISKNAVDAKTLQDSKNKFNGNFALGMESKSNIANYALTTLTQNLPKDYYTNYLKNINAVTPAQLQATAKKYILANSLKIFVIGKASEFKDKLARLGYKINIVDKFAKPVEEKVVTAPPSVSPEPLQVAPSNTTTVELTSSKAVIDNAIEAMGGKDAISKVNTVMMKGNMEVQGMAIELVIKKMMPNKEAQIVQAGGRVFQKTFFDGTKGTESGMQGSKDMEAADITDKKANISVFDELNILAKNATFMGSEKINGNDAYKLKGVTPKGDAFFFFDKKSGLLVAAKDKQPSPMGGEVDVTTYFTNYKKVNNILFPFTMQRDLGEMNMVVEMESIKVNEGVTEADFKE